MRSAALAAVAAQVHLFWLFMLPRYL